jgi:hypothetical protein
MHMRILFCGFCLRVRVLVYVCTRVRACVLIDRLVVVMVELVVVLLLFMVMLCYFVCWSCLPLVDTS